MVLSSSSRSLEKQPEMKRKPKRIRMLCGLVGRRAESVTARGERPGSELHILHLCVDQFSPGPHFGRMHRHSARSLPALGGAHWVMSRGPLPGQQSATVGQVLLLYAQHAVPV